MNDINIDTFADGKTRHPRDIRIT